MSGFCGNICKYAMFLCNFIFFCFGIALIAIGSYISIRMQSYFDFEGNSYFAGAFAIIGIGVVILVVSFFGCCGICTENSFMMRTLGFLIFLLIVAEIAVSVAFVYYRSKAEEIILNNMIGEMGKYGDPDFALVKTEWDSLQSEFSCCGTRNYTDWFSTNYSRVPDSCCQKVSVGCASGITPDSNNDIIFADGCLTGLNKLINNNLSLVISVGIGIAVLEVIGIIVACCFATNFSNSYA